MRKLPDMDLRHETKPLLPDRKCRQGRVVSFASDRAVLSHRINATTIERQNLDPPRRKNKANFPIGAGHKAFAKKHLGFYDPIRTFPTIAQPHAN
jgi:hypothetical protein